MIPEDDIHLSFIEDRPERGMWHCGPNNCWVEATHLPTMMSVRCYGRQSFKVKDTAISMLELLVSEFGDDPASFPDRVHPEKNSR